LSSEIFRNAIISVKTPGKNSPPKKDHDFFINSGENSLPYFVTNKINPRPAFAGRGDVF
jgi:hypothetical protein